MTRRWRGRSQTGPEVTRDDQEATTLRRRLYHGRPTLGFSGRDVAVPCLRSTYQRRRREIP